MNVDRMRYYAVIFCMFSKKAVKLLSNLVKLQIKALSAKLEADKENVRRCLAEINTLKVRI